MSLYPFQWFQKLRIFRKGEKIRNVQNLPIKFINESCWCDSSRRNDAAYWDVGENIMTYAWPILFAQKTRLKIRAWNSNIIHSTCNLIYVGRVGWFHLPLFSYCSWRHNFDNITIISGVENTDYSLFFMLVSCSNRQPWHSLNLHNKNSQQLFNLLFNSQCP